MQRPTSGAVGLSEAIIKSFIEDVTDTLALKDSPGKDYRLRRLREEVEGSGVLGTALSIAGITYDDLLKSILNGEFKR